MDYKGGGPFRNHNFTHSSATRKKGTPHKKPFRISIHSETGHLLGARIRRELPEAGLKHFGPIDPAQTETTSARARRNEPLCIANPALMSLSICKASSACAVTLYRHKSRK